MTQATGVCLWCGRYVFDIPGSSGPHKLYCNPECRKHAYAVERKKKRAHAKWVRQYNLKFRKPDDDGSEFG